MQYTDEQIQKMLELKESIIDKMTKVLVLQKLLHYLEKKNQNQRSKLKKRTNQNQFKLRKIKMEKSLPMHLLLLKKFP
jgi:hypothetical protein